MKIVSLYNGTVHIEFDDINHFYRVVGTAAKPDGVTTILELIPKYLLKWVATTDCGFMRDGILRRLQTDGTIEPSFLSSLYEEAIKQHDVKRDKAGDIGTLVHAFAQKVIETGDLNLTAPIEAHPGCEAFLSWWDGIRASNVQSERIIFSKRLFYCGTCDLFAHIDGKPTVVDFKTGSGFYEDQPLQLAAYALALEEEHGFKPGEDWIKDGWIIHLDKETGKCTPYHVEITPELKTDWEAVRIAWRAVKRNQERHKEIKKCRQSMNTTQAAPAL